MRGSRLPYFPRCRSPRFFARSICFCLWRKRRRSSSLRAPWRYLHFLEFAVERGFLQRVGGGFVFVHRALLEYFADLHQAGSDGDSRR